MYSACDAEISATVAPARLDMACWAGGGIILSSLAIMYQLGLVFHAGEVTSPEYAPTPQGTWDTAMKLARLGFTSAANDARNLAGSRRRKPSVDGRTGGSAAPGGGFAPSLATGSPASGAKAAT